MGGVPVPRAGAGMCARRRTFFSCVAKKRRQKKATPSLRPLRDAKGQTCAGAVAGCAVELALLLRSAARTTTASQLTRHARIDAHAHPATAPPQAQPDGGGQLNSQTAKQPNSHTGHCCARPSLRSAWRLRPSGSGRAQRRPVWLSGFGFPSGCAEERSGQRIRARDCLSATQWSEFERDPAGREHRRLPAAKRRDAACRVAFSWLTFFWRGKRK